MRKVLLAAVLILILVLSGCTAWVIKQRSPGTGTIKVYTYPAGLQVTIERAGKIVAEGIASTPSEGKPLVFNGAEVDRNYAITAENEDGLTVTETRSITKTGGSVTVTLNLNEA